MNVIVTGGTGALGRAVVAAFAADGHRVFVPYRSAARFQELAAAVAGVIGAPCDLLDPQAVVAAFAQAEPIDALVCCAGGYSEAAVADLDPQEWRRLLDLNVTTAFHSIRAVLPGMRQRRRGRIVTVASRYGLVGDAGLAAYSAGKGALIRLTETVAAEGRACGVTANAVLPGIIDTPQNRADMPGADPSRWVPPTAIAAVIRFLCSDAAAIISGAAIPVYGAS